jgi:hypothetical protein
VLGISSLDTLLAAKETYGEVLFLDYRDTDLVTAHRRLGEEVSEQVLKILGRKIKSLKPNSFYREIRLVRAVLQSAHMKIEGGQIHAAIVRALQEYLDCLNAWSEGAGLRQAVEQFGGEGVVDGRLVTPLEMGLYLQNDNTGCQTGVFREMDGSVILWHTEEDVENEPAERFDRSRIAMFRLPEENGRIEACAFIYPDLLPGPAYSWRQDQYLLAVDALYLKPYENTAVLLGNMACWILFRLGRTISAYETIHDLGPFYDGYSVLVLASSDDGRVNAERMEFAGDQINRTTLPTEPASHLFQVNILSTRSGPLAFYENIDVEGRNSIEARLKRTARWFEHLRTLADPLHCCRRLVASRIGGSSAYANPDVKSYFLARITGKMLTAWVGSGPALKTDPMREFRYIR